MTSPAAGISAPSSPKSAPSPPKSLCHGKLAPPQQTNTPDVADSRTGMREPAYWATHPARIGINTAGPIQAIFPFRGGIAIIALFYFAAGFGANEAAADGKAWAALRQGGAFVLRRYGSAEPRNNPQTHSPGNCARERNLSDRGRRERTRMGAAFRRRGISVTTVLVGLVATGRR